MLSMNKKDGSNLVYEADLSKFLASHDGENKDSDYDGINNWTNHTGSMMSVTSKGVWLAEFVNEKGNRSYFTYNMKDEKAWGLFQKESKTGTDQARDPGRCDTADLLIKKGKGRVCYAQQDRKKYKKTGRICNTAGSIGHIGGHAGSGKEYDIHSSMKGRSMFM